MTKKALTVTDQQFYFGGPQACETVKPDRSTRRVCYFCGKRYSDHGLPVFLQPRCRAGAWAEEMCGDCLTADPRVVAEFARKQSPVIRRRRPGPDDDEDIYTGNADDMLRLADLFDTLDSFDAIPGGIIARKIGEAYRELDAPKRRRKAA